MIETCFQYIRKSVFNIAPSKAMQRHRSKISASPTVFLSPKTKAEPPFPSRKQIISPYHGYIGMFRSFLVYFLARYRKEPVFLLSLASRVQVSVQVFAFNDLRYLYRGVAFPVYLKAWRQDTEPCRKLWNTAREFQREKDSKNQGLSSSSLSCGYRTIHPFQTVRKSISHPPIQLHHSVSVQGAKKRPLVQERTLRTICV